MMMHLVFIPIRHQEYLLQAFDALTSSYHTFKVVDLQGRTVLAQEYTLEQGAPEITIDMPAKAKGIYMLHISNSTGTDIQNLILQ